MIDLSGKHLVVTGARGVLGAAVADRAIELGARLTLADLTAPKGRFEERWIAADLADAATSAAALVELGPVDALLCIAGGFDMGPQVHETSPELFAQMMAINVTTLQNTLRAVVPGMVERGRGSIVTVGALSATSGQAYMGAYTAAKSAVMRLTEALSAELKEVGVRANCVLPSLIDTPANRRAMSDADFSRWVSPRELANVICFLASEGASSITGALIPVAGRV